MNNSLSSQDLEVKAVGQAIQCCNLTAMLDSIPEMQPVLVMSLERSITCGNLGLSQWIIHITTRSDASSPIYFVSLLAAEVQRRAIGSTLIMPTVHERLKEPISRAHHFQEQLYDCVVRLLLQSSRVSQIVPARHCLPEEWVWSSWGSEPHIQFRDELWTLVTPTC